MTDQPNPTPDEPIVVTDDQAEPPAPADDQAEQQPPAPADVLVAIALAQPADLEPLPHIGAERATDLVDAARAMLGDDALAELGAKRLADAQALATAQAAIDDLRQQLATATARAQAIELTLEQRETARDLVQLRLPYPPVAPSAADSNFVRPRVELSAQQAAKLRAIFQGVGRPAAEPGHAVSWLLDLVELTPAPVAPPAQDIDL